MNCLSNRSARGRARCALAAALLSAAALAPASAQDRSARAVVGMSTPLTGPSAGYGTALAQGVRAAVARANQSSEGPRIELMLIDDAGLPDKAAANTVTLLQAKAVALTGYHGAAVVEAVMPLLDAQGTPMIGAASSAESLRSPARPWLFNLRPSAAEETAAIVYHLDTIGIDRIAGLVQNDGLGRAGLEGIRAELVRIGNRPVAVAEVAVKPTAAQMQDAIQQVCRPNPQAVLLALNPDSALAAIRHARQAGCRPQFYLLSETGNGLVGAGGTASELSGVVVAQVLPSLSRTAHPLVADYLQDLGRVDGALPGYVSLEGYLYGRTIISALRLCARNITGDCLMQALERGRVEVPGHRIHFAREQRRGLGAVELTMFGPDGRLRR